MNLILQNLYELAKERPLRTVEILASNDYYANAHILKKYIGYPENYPLKAAIEHGVYLRKNSYWSMEVNAPLPALIIPSPCRFPILKTKTKKLLYSIGPIINYAPHFLDEKDLKAEKKRLGRNLLVFPHHSAHFIKHDYDIQQYCKVLTELAKDFDTVRICLYWQNILWGQAQEYMKYGFECVTAGHRYDPSFLPRLKSIIYLADITTSNMVSSHVGYCILMNKPHYIYKSKVSSMPKIPFIKIHLPDKNAIKEWDKLMKVFEEFRYDITPLQKDIVEEYWGLSNYKTRKELKVIFDEAEYRYRKSFYPFVSPFFRFFEKIRRSKIKQDLLNLIGRDFKNSDKYPEKDNIN